LALLIVLAACEGVVERDEEAVGAEPGAAAADDPAAGGAARLGAASGDGYFDAGTEPGTPGLGAATVEVILRGRSIEMPPSLPAGRVTFVVSNGGEERHGFEIEGNGVEQEIEPLEPGTTGSLAVDLAPGSYTVYCPLGDHRREGMVMTLEVVG
jgi:hypothetical protein